MTGDTVLFKQRNGIKHTGTIVGINYKSKYPHSIDYYARIGLCLHGKESLKPHIGRSSYTIEYNDNSYPVSDSYIIAVKTPRSYRYLRIPIKNVIKGVKEEIQQELNLPPKQKEVKIVVADGKIANIYPREAYSVKSYTKEEIVEIVNNATIAKIGAPLMHSTADKIDIITIKGQK